MENCSKAGGTLELHPAIVNKPINFECTMIFFSTIKQFINHSVATFHSHSGKKILTEI